MGVTAEVIGPEPYEVSFAETERILYDYRQIELAIGELTPRGHGGLISISGNPSTSSGSQVEELAIRRARLSIVYDTVQRVHRALSPNERLLVELRYFDNLTWRQAGERLDPPIAERTAHDWKQRIIPIFQQALQRLGRTVLHDFWSAYQEHFAQ